MISANGFVTFLDSVHRAGGVYVWGGNVEFGTKELLELKKKTYGKGNIKGVLAPESANNGVTGATLIPMLTLGIPGDNCVAIMGAALILHGITPGPALFTENRFWAYCLMGGLLLVNIFMLIQGSVLVRAFANVSK